MPLLDLGDEQRESSRQRAQWKINRHPSLKRERASLQESPVASFDTRGEGHELERETIPARACRGLSAELLGLR